MVLCIIKTRHALQYDLIIRDTKEVDVDLRYPEALNLLYKVKRCGRVKDKLKI